MPEWVMPRRVSSAFAETIFLGVICLAPLPYGSRDASTVSLWCMLLALALIFVPLRELGAPQRWASCAIISFLSLFTLMLHEQLSVSPWFASADPVWGQAQQVLGKRLAASASIVRNEPFFALGPMLAGVLSLWLGILLGADRRRAWRVIWCFAVSGFFYAVFGIISLLIAPDRLLLRERESFIGYVTGPFVNHNTAAIYFGSCTVIWMLLFLQEIRKYGPRDFIRPDRIAGLAELIGRRRLWLFFGPLLICLIALFLTGSRAGVVLSSSVLTFALITILSFDQGGHRITFLSAKVLGFVACLIILLGGTLNARFAMLGFEDGGRSLTYASSLHLIADHPWMGTGLGTFEWAFPAYRSSRGTLWGIWDLAHSTPLELASDLGIPFALFIGCCSVVMFCILGRGIVVRRRDKILPLGAFCVGLLGLLHSMMDFSLQVPGFAIVAMAVVGAGLAQSFRTSSPALSRSEPLSVDQ